jgi:hypothetical protein
MFRPNETRAGIAEGTIEILLTQGKVAIIDAEDSSVASHNYRCISTVENQELACHLARL